ncbi:MAG: ABC transporter substrate-binding protein [Gammaproteobacteria bacterium]|nr:ABC transporter substrate-binding protein [Gammaproteobacteria bacterium]MYF29638.1 ABC transporter substrate-binding protein [Gammaproteobacteria bacterium]MYK45917.1 ABC transporter substrate-binding protein [Gammaproteobacteria bacterium]
MKWPSLQKRCLPGLILLLAIPSMAEPPAYRHGISLLHELKYPADFEHFEYANPDAPKGGELRLAATNPIRNFAGVPGTGVPGAQGLGRTVDRLMIRSADELSGLYGQLADGIALAADRRSLFIRLNDKAHWHDGVPVTTTDVKFSYDELLKRAFGKVYLQSWIEALEIVNARELIIHHRRAFTNSNLVALTWFPIRPAHYYAGKDSSTPTLVPPVGSGPYRVADFDADFVRYERVEDYWGRDIPVNRGRYNFDAIRYDVYRDATVAREAIRKGLFDIYFETDIRHWVSSYDIPALATGSLVMETRSVQKFIGLATGIVLNLDRPRLRDVRVREALTLALDFEWQNRVFQYGSQTRATSYFANSPFAATGPPTQAELAVLAPYRDRLPERVFTQAFRLPVSDATRLNRTALERARNLFAEAGWTLKDGRLVNAAGQVFELELTTQNPAQRRVLLPYIEALETLGIDARLRLLDNVAWVNNLRKRDFDAYVRGHDFLNPPLGELESYFGSGTADLELGGNMAGLRNPIVDALIDHAERMVGSLEEAMTACRALDRVLLWGFYHIPLNIPDEERFVRWDKFARPKGEAVAKYEYLVGSSVRILDSWWIDPDKAGATSAPYSDTKVR